MNTPTHRILIVEDDPALRLTWQTAFRRSGFEVDIAVTAQEALRAYTARRPDLVVLDLMLADKRLSGYDIVQQIRALQHDRQTYIMIVSGNGEEARQVLGWEMGVDDFFVKPLTADQLLHRVKARLQRLAPREWDSDCKAYDLGGLKLDLRASTLEHGAKRVQLSGLECTVLGRLVRTPNQVVPHEELLKLGWHLTTYPIQEHHREWLKHVMKRLHHKAERLGADLEIRAIRYRGYSLTIAGQTKDGG